MSSLLVFVYILEIQSVMLVFSTQLCELLPLYGAFSLCKYKTSLFSLVHLPHPSPPLPEVNVQNCIYRQCVAGRRWGEGVELCRRQYSAGDKHSVCGKIRNLEGEGVLDR
jgi:hypothetical protein